MQLKDKNVLLLSGGTIEIEFAKAYLQNNSFDMIIAVDSGLVATDKLGIIPDFIVGDFDSVPADVLNKYKHIQQSDDKKSMIYEYSPVKDCTDTHIAIEHAISQKATSITILGATGTRIDHMLGNVNLLMIPLINKINCYIIDTHNKIYLIDSNIKLRKEQLHGPYLSLIPLTRKVLGVTLKGFKYPLQNRDLSIEDSLGISNEVCNETATVEFNKGIIIVVESRD